MNTIQLLVSLQRAWRSRRGAARQHARPHARPRPLVWALALAGVATHSLGPWAGDAHAAAALPTGLNVVAGQATVVQSGNQMTVNNSAGAMLNWQSFNIGAANAVRFEQPNAGSKVFNRVVGNNPSQIFGKLSSNGEVWLVNPYGVLFGRDARVDVRSLVVSTLNIGNDDWRAGRYSLTGGAGSTASIVNQGELRTTTGGRVLLLAGAGGVRNEGLITAPDGQVALAAGASVDLVDGQTRHLAVRVQAPQGEVLNLGSLAVGGGRVDLVAAMVNQQGFVRADSLAGSGGEIVLQGSQGVNLAAGSVTSAAGASGGQVSADGGSGTTLLAGVVNLTGSAGHGGDALLLGRQVGLLDGALADASGATGGGRVRVGGGLQGHDSSVTNAQAVYMGPGMQIRADALGSGDGGTIILWSNEATRAYGALSARGGVDGGNGGFIETSGGWLDARPAAVRTDAARGQAGQWLLDPNDIRIVSQGVNTNVTPGPNFGTTNDSAVILASTISDALRAGNNVTITTGTAGTNAQGGDISMSNVFISADPAQRVSLTLTAARDILMFDSTIRSTTAPMDVTFSAANGSSGSGSIDLTGSNIVTRGGNIALGGATRAVGINITSPRAGAVGVGGSEEPAIGVNVLGTTLDAGAGNVSITGQAIPRGTGAAGVFVGDFFDFNGETSTLITSNIFGRDIDIYGWVDGNNAEIRRGVYITGDSVLRATHGLTITGVANSAVFNAGGQQAVQPIGVSVEGGSLSVQPLAPDSTAFLNIDGTVNDGATTQGFGGLRLGVSIAGTSSLLASGGAAVNIVGHDLMNDASTSAAIQINGGTQLDFADAGNVRLDGNTRVTLDGQIEAPTSKSLTAIAGDQLSFGGTLSGDPSAVSFIGRDILLEGNLNFGSSIAATLDMSASRDVRIDDARITSDGALVTINISAASGGAGAGSVVVVESDISSGGGNITIGGGTRAVGPNISSPRAGAVGVSDGDSDAVGVSLSGVSIDAGSGNVSITGQALPNGFGGVGVLLRDGPSDSLTEIRGRDIAIYGWVDGNDGDLRRGVSIVGNSLVLATHGLTITGVANSALYSLVGDSGTQPIGLSVESGTLSVQPQMQDSTAFLTIDGTVNEGLATAPDGVLRLGVSITGSSPTVSAGGGASVNITGRDLLAQPGNTAAVLTGPDARLDFVGAPTVKIEGIGSDIFVGGSLFLGDVGPTVLTLSAARDIRIAGANISSEGELITMNITAAAGGSGAGTVTIQNSSLYSGDGDITIGGGSTATGPNITAPGTGAVATDSTASTAGVSILGSRIDAGNGKLRISGQSISGADDAYGVLLRSWGGEGGADLRGGDIDIVGWVDSNAAVRRTGVWVEQGANIYATNSLKITGLANSTVFQSGDVAPTGVLIDGFVNLQPTFFFPPGGVRPRPQILGVAPPPQSQDPVLSIVGTTNDGLRSDGEAPTRYGVHITESGSVYVGFFDRAAPRATISEGAPPEIVNPVATITGTDRSANDEMSVRMVSRNAYFDAAASLSIQGNHQVELGGTIQAPNNGPMNVRAGTTLTLSDVQVYGSPTQVNLRGDNLLLAGGTLNFENPTAITLQSSEARLGWGSEFSAITLGTIRVLTDHYVTDQASTLDATATGTAIAIAGYDGQSGIRTLQSTEGPAAMNTVNGRSLVYAVDDSIPDGGLNFSFRQYGMTYPTEPTATGNGLVYTLAPVLTLSSQTPITKVYDGNNTVTTAGVALQLTGVRPGQFLDESFGSPALSYPGVNVAANQLLNVSGYSQPTVSDSGERPVYGYTTQFNVRGDITPRPVTASGISANDKVYDGSRAATLFGGVLSNLVSGETLTLALGGGQFDTANAGTGKLVSGSASLLDGSGLASNYTLVNGSVSTTASITPRTLTVSNVTVAGKVYDGSAAAELSGGTLNNLVAGELLGLNFSSGLFGDANAGTGKAVTGSATLANGNGGLASNYQLASGGAVAGTGNITPRQLTLANLLATAKVYDGTRNITLTGGSLSGLVEGEALGLSFANSQLVTAGVGTNKPVSTTATLLNGNGGRASNYTLLAPEGGVYGSNAAVTPATLLYQANAVSLLPSELGRTLTGSVTGFVAGETAASATSGTLLFSTNATGSSAPGPYPINGSGLSAANYVFAQAEGNATALTLLSVAPVVVTETVGLPEIDHTQRSYRQALPPLPRGPEGTRTLDALQSMRVDATWLSMSFGELDLSSLSREEVAALLEARRQYKMSVLAVGRDKLAIDPSLADVPACQTVRQSETGRCLVTAELLAAVDAGGETASIPPQPPLPAPPLPAAAPRPPSTAVSPIPVAPLPTAPLPAVAAATPAAPLPTPAAPAAPAPAPAPALATAPSTAPVTPAPAPVEARVPPRVRVAAQPVLQAPPLPVARPVRNASIPQIQRKIAVLVGIDNYVDERIPALDNARRDVDAVARVLENRLGYETIIVRDAGREAMVGILNKLALQVRPTDSVVVYYAGHGTVIDGTGQGYWIPATADAERPETWISNRDIGRLLGGIRASQVVLISDSCFSGSLVGDKRIQASSSTDPRPLLQRRATLVMSSGGDEPVADGARNGHSPFANSLMFNLQNLDNWRPGGNVFERVLTEVTQRLPQTPRYGPARDTRFVEGGDYLFEQRELAAR